MEIFIYNFCTLWLYKLYEEYINNIKKFIENTYSINVHIKIIEEDIDCTNEIKELDYLNKIIFCGNVSPVNKILNSYNADNLYYLNIEQMSHPSYYKLIRNLKDNIKILDYSEENIPYFSNIYKNIFLLPPYFEETINIYKNIDVISFSNNEYRKNILDNVNPKFNLKYLDNIFGDQRDEIFKKSKIYINIHSSEDHNTMELIRIINLLRNKVIVITQPSVYKDLLYIKDCLLFFKDEAQLNNIINSVLTNYSFYYQYIFINSELNNYNNYVNANIIKFLED